MTRPTQKTSASVLCGLTGVLLLSSAALAQSPSATGGPSGPPPGYGGPPPGYGGPGGSSTGGAATGEGAISNETTTTTTTTMTDADPMVSTEPLPNTGGEPLLVSMLGAMVAGGAFFMRRKVS